MSSEIIISPEYSDIVKEISKLRVELSMLVAEKDDLIYVVCKNLETEYILRFGALEYNVFEAECEYLRLRRKLDLIQAKINRSEPVDNAQLEKILDVEFEKYRRIADEKINSVNEALRHSRCEILSEKDTAELKRLYRKIIKSLHPDFNHEQTENKKELFNNAVKAYQNGDLTAMKIIDAMLGEEIPFSESLSSIEQLQDEKIRLKILIDATIKAIEGVKTEFPYTIRELLESKAMSEKYISDLNDMIADYKSIISVIKEKIKGKLG